MTDQLLERTHASLAWTLETIASRSHGTVERSATRLLYAVPVDDPVLWSGVARLDPSADAGALVEEALAFAATLGHGLTLWSRDAGDEDLEAAATAAGFRHVESTPEMVIEHPMEVVWPGAPAGTETRIVRDEAGLAALIAVVQAAFADLGAAPGSWPAAYPDLAAIASDDVIGMLAGTADGVGGVGVGYLHDGVGELVHIGTHPAHRHKGIGTAVTLALSEELCRRGADLLSLQAAPMGEPIYRRLGFREIGGYRWWLSPGA